MSENIEMLKKSAILFLFPILCLSVFAQTKARKPAKKNVKPTEVVKTTAPPDEVPQTTPEPPKKNVRDNAETNGSEKTPQKKNQKNSDSQTKPKAEKYNYRYEFSNEQFIVRNVVIEHDENGQGKISFLKKDFDEPVTDPIKLSPVTLEKLKTLFKTLDFVNSTENYQSAERDYKHLGTSKIRLTENGKERTAEYNWTENKDAKALADEYRKISNQYIWQFDITISRENQPLEAPSLMDALDSYLRRNEISDPPQIIPFLKQLSNDERIPLIARNKAAKMAERIEKGKP